MCNFVLVLCINFKSNVIFILFYFFYFFSTLLNCCLGGVVHACLLLYTVFGGALLYRLYSPPV